MTFLAWFVGFIALIWVLAYLRASRLGVGCGRCSLPDRAASLAGLPPLWRGTAVDALHRRPGAAADPAAAPRAGQRSAARSGSASVLPQVSQTEQEALDAGTVWWDGELFSGRPDWNKLLAVPQPRADARKSRRSSTARWKSCAACVDDWKITHELNDLPPEVWQFIKDSGFLGMIIPQAVWRHGLLRLGAFRGGDEARRAAAHRLRVGDGAELAGAGRTAAALRHRGAEELLSAAPGEGPGDAVLRADRARGRFGRRLDSRLRHRVQGRARGQAKCSASG